MSINYAAKAVDTEYQDHTITSIDETWDTGWAVTMDTGWTIIVQNEGIEPHVGDAIRLYGPGWGRIVRGIDINGRTVRYLSADEQKGENQRQILERQRRDEAEYSRKSERFEAEIAALPEPFQVRIRRFQHARPVAFNVEHLGYELFTCQEAVKIADHCKTVEGIQAFRDLPYEDQRAVISDQHSGNTFGAACGLARLYLTQPDVLWQQHGALCPLVGCKEYGCYAAYPDVTP